MSFMTKIAGVPDSDDVKPGMAFFAGTGPHGKHCGDCKFRGLTRQSRKAVYSEQAQEFIHKSYRTTQGAKYKSLSGVHGATVKKDYDACKYFESKDKKLNSVSEAS